MESTNKIPQEQLDRVIKDQKDLTTTLTSIGVLEAQKHSYLHQLVGINKSIEEFKIELEQQYGAININIEDGSYEIINT